MIRLADLPEYPELNAFSPVRANLVRTLDLAGTERVMVIGADSAAITAFFAQKCDSVTAVCLNEREAETQSRITGKYDNLRLTDCLERDECYDLITVIGSVKQADSLCRNNFGESEDPFYKMIGEQLLFPEGRILLADEKNAFSEGFIRQLSKNMGKEAAEYRLFQSSQLFRILPDYRFPMELKSAGTLSETEGESVLILLSKKPAEAGKLTPVYTKFSNERRPECAVYTQILSETAGKTEKRIVRKYPAVQDAEKHIRRIESISGKLRELYADTGIGVNRCHIAGETGNRETAAGKNESIWIEFEYLTGLTYEQEVNQILQKRGTEEAIEAVRDYIARMIPAEKCVPFHFVPAFAELFGNRAHEPFWRRTLPMTNIDMILENVIKTEARSNSRFDQESPGSECAAAENDVQYQMIDCEWTTDIPVPVEFLIWRIIHYYLDGCPDAEKLIRKGIFEKCGLSGNLDVYLDMENQFQKWIEGDVIPLHKYISEAEEQQRENKSLPQADPETALISPAQLTVQQKIRKHGSYLLKHGYKGYRYMLQTRPNRPFDECYESWIRKRFAKRKPELFSGEDLRFGIILLRGRFDRLQYTAACKSVEQQRYSNYRIYSGTVLRKLMRQAARDCDYLIVLPSGYVLAPDALQYFAAEIFRGQNKEQLSDSADAPKYRPYLIYADEDSLTKDGKRGFDPVFKPDFSIDYLRSSNYIGMCYCISSCAVKKIPLRELQTGDGFFYDLLLRVCEMKQSAEGISKPEKNRICHVPEILFRRIKQEGKSSADLRKEAQTRFLELDALKQHYRRCKVEADVAEDPVFPVFRTKFRLQEEPLVSIIVPNKDHVEELRACMDSFECLSAYRHYEWIIVENNSSASETFAYYRELEQQESHNVTVVTYEGIFNYAKINNFGVRHAKGEYLLLLNNDTELISPDALQQLVGTAMQEGVGIAGARLLYPDHRLQHGGIGLGIGGIAGHLFTDLEETDPGYGYRAVSTVDYSAVTAACLLVKRAVYNTVGGMEESLAVAFNDVDFCLKVRALGKRVVYCGDVELYHKESRSRGLEDTQEKVDRFYSEIIWFIEHWRDEICAGDPYYNPNLSTGSNPFYQLRN